MNSNLEPVALMPNLICTTCGMTMLVERRARMDGCIGVRYPCDSCKNTCTLFVKVPVVVPALNHPRDGDQQP